MSRRCPRPAGSGRHSCSEVLAAIARRNSLFFGIRVRRFLDDRAQQCAIRLNPAANDLPLLAVPLLEAYGAAALVIGARQFQRLNEAVRAQLLQTRVVEIQVLKTPADLFARKRVVAEPGLSHA